MIRTVGSLVAGIALLSLSAGCRGHLPVHAVVSVANLSRDQATFHWESPGLFPDTGTEPIVACGSYVRAFDAGDQRITITRGASKLEFALSAPTSGEKMMWIVVASDGRISEASEATAPTPGVFC
jgi:hypothetical protein